jgi:hypothetical protein
MKKILGTITGVAMLLGGCNKSADVKTSVPASAAVTIKTPGSGSALLGETSEWYRITVGATTIVNLSAVAVLDLVHAIVQQPPTSHVGDVYTWGPSVPTGLEANSWKMTVTANTDGSFSYQLDGRKKGDDTGAFTTVLSGSHLPVDATHGSGTFLLDFTARNQLNNPDSNTVGTADVTYDHKTEDANVDVLFTGIKDSAGTIVNATYHYKQPSGGDGLFQYSAPANVDNKGATEYVTVESRWKSTGAGRSDLKVTKGDLGTGSASGSQCWDTGFKTLFNHLQSDGSAANPDFSADEGHQTDCAFAAAEYYAGN